MATYDTLTVVFRVRVPILQLKGGFSNLYHQTFNLKPIHHPELGSIEQVVSSAVCKIVLILVGSIPTRPTKYASVAQQARATPL